MNYNIVLSVSVIIWTIINYDWLTFVAHIKQVVTTLATQFIRSLVCCITVSTLLKVADFPTVGDLRVKLSCWQRIGKRSKCVTRSVLWVPAGTWNHIHIKNATVTTNFSLQMGNWESDRIMVHFHWLRFSRLFAFEDINVGTFYAHYRVLLFTEVSVSCNNLICN